jgi:hypothetical protein
MTEPKPDILSNLLVLVFRIFMLTVGFRYVGFNAEQTLFLTLSIVGAISIK